MIESIILGLIQGLTEFLPVSSSGHLVLFGNWLSHTEDNILFEVLLHVGTLLATVIVFRTEIWALIVGILKRDKLQLQKAGFIIIASIPTGIIGLTLKDTFEKAFHLPQLVAGFLLFTGMIILGTKFFAKEDTDISMNWWKAFLIGFAQSFAILPGISRSGSTICTALFLKISRKEAGEFSFLISLPAILGATLLQVKDIFDPGVNINIGMPELFGVLASFLSGLFALKWLLAYVRKGRMYVFAPYVFSLGLFGLYYFN